MLAPGDQGENSELKRRLADSDGACGFLQFFSHCYFKFLQINRDDGHAPVMI